MALLGHYPPVKGVPLAAGVSGPGMFENTFCLSRVRKWLKTNTRIADERLSLLRPWAILFTSAEVVKLSRCAISHNPSQNSFSRDTLVLCPSSTTERLMMSVFTMFSRAANQCSNCRPRPRRRGTGNTKFEIGAALSWGTRAPPNLLPLRPSRSSTLRDGAGRSLSAFLVPFFKR
jgi:hypothetical protein